MVAIVVYDGGARVYLFLWISFLSVAIVVSGCGCNSGCGCFRCLWVSFSSVFVVGAGGFVVVSVGFIVGFVRFWLCPLVVVVVFVGRECCLRVS